MHDGLPLPARLGRVYHRFREAYMAFREGLLLGTVVGAVATLLYTPLDGRDARAVLLGPFGWREFETEPPSEWSPTRTQEPPAPILSK
jgi:hypothetical protein